MSKKARYVPEKKYLLLWCTKRPYLLCPSCPFRGWRCVVPGSARVKHEDTKQRIISTNKTTLFSERALSYFLRHVPAGSLQPRTQGVVYISWRFRYTKRPVLSHFSLFKLPNVYVHMCMSCASKAAQAPGNV